MRRAAVVARDPVAARVMSAAEGYDLAASSYDEWPWSRFWDRVETPLVREWLVAQPRGEVVDLGCGSGRYRRLIQDLGNSYTGVDISKKMLAENRAKHRDVIATRTAVLVAADVRHTTLASGAAHSIVCTRVLSHIAEPRDLFAEICRLLIPGGECFLSDIDPSHAYEYTHMPTPHGDIAIETYKHSWPALAKAISDTSRLTVLRREVHTPQSLHPGATPLKLPNGRAAARRPLLDVCVLKCV
ncbi:MAG TPA: class I SAM-dependent methyltransferase [Candidatus Eremiobacteraceae bacterium]